MANGPRITSMQLTVLLPGGVDKLIRGGLSGIGERGLDEYDAARFLLLEADDGVVAGIEDKNQETWAEEESACEEIKAVANVGRV